MPKKHQEGLFCSSYNQELLLNINLKCGLFAEHVYLSYNKVLPNVWAQYGGKKSPMHMCFFFNKKLSKITLKCSW